MGPIEAFHDLRYRVMALLRRDTMDRELNDELHFHLQRETEKYIRDGMSPADAERWARLAFGGVDNMAEATRDARGLSSFDSVRQDVRFAVRTLARNAGFTATAVIVLALGIAGTTAIVSLADAVLVRPVPGVGGVDRLVSLSRTQGSGRYNSFGYPDYIDLGTNNRTLSQLAAYVGTPVSAAMRDGPARRLRAQLVTGNFFRTLEVSPSIGRLLDAQDDQPGAPPVVVVSHGYWQRELGGTVSIVGTILRLDGHAFTIVGVASPDFSGPAVGQAIDLWAALATQPVLLSRMSAGVMSDRSAGWLALIGRLAPGADVDGAAVELRTIASRLAAAYPATNTARVVDARAGIGLAESTRSELSRTLGLLSMAVTLVMLVACANVAGLLLVRGVSRRREIAARMALGASRGRLVRQLLIEGGVLATVAGILAVSLAALLARLATRIQPEGSLLRGVETHLDARMLAVAGVATLVSVLLFGIVPALRASELDPATVLRDGSTGGGGQRRMQRLLISVQVGLAFALLVTATVVSVSIQRLLARPTGFDTRGVVMVSIDLSAEGYAEDRGLALYHRLIRRLGEDATIGSASFAKTVPPLDWSDRVSIFAPGTEPSPQEIRDRGLTLGYRVRADGIAPRYFEAMGIRLLRGRDFTARDDVEAPEVAIVNESLARAFFGTDNPVGRRFAWPEMSGPPRPPSEVIGVVADHQYTTLIGAPEALLYFPVLQRYDGRTTIVARSSSGDAAAMRALERAVRDVDPQIATYGSMTMRTRMAGSVWQQRMLALWLAVFGALGLTMSVVGLYGVVAQSVAQRTRELSLRMALGASPRRLRRSVVIEGLALGLIGVAAGAPLALAGGMVVPMERPSVAAWLISAALVLAATILASYLPARRAARLNPADALKST